VGKTATKTKHDDEPPQSTAAEIERSLADLEAERERLTAKVAELTGQRHAALLSGDDALEAHEREVQRAQNGLVRIDARQEVLNDDLDEAEAREEAAARLEAHEEASAKLKDGRKALAEYDRAAKELAKIARRITGADYACSQVNDKLPPGLPPLGPVEPDNSRPACPDKYRDATTIVAINRRNGQETLSWSPGDPNIIFVERPTGRRKLVSTAYPGKPHRSAICGLCIPSLDPNESPYF
jgi:hypothetical protein